MSQQQQQQHQQQQQKYAKVRNEIIRALTKAIIIQHHARPVILGPSVHLLHLQPTQSRTRRKFTNGRCFDHDSLRELRRLTWVKTLQIHIHSTPLSKRMTKYVSNIFHLVSGPKYTSVLLNVQAFFFFLFKSNIDI